MGDLDMVPGLPTKRDPPEQLDLSWNKRSGAAPRWEILRSPQGPMKPRSKEGAHEAPTGGLLGLAHWCQYYKPPRGRNWIGGARMPLGTEWVGGICPTTPIGQGNDAPTPWMGWGITGELRGDVEGHGGPEYEIGGPWGPIRGGRAPGVA